MHPSLKLTYEEFLSEASALPRGRPVTAVLEVQTYVTAGPEPVEPDTLQLAVEIRRERDGEFEELERTPRLVSGGRAAINVPPLLAADNLEMFAYGGAFRVRVIHHGRLLPGYRLSIEGL